VAAAALWHALYRGLIPLSEALVGLLPVTRHSSLGNALQFFLYDTPKVLVLLTGVVFVMGVVNSYFTPERTRALLAGRTEGLANVMAASLGIVTPFCSCSAVPLFIGFVQAGVPLGVTFSFLISAPMVPIGALYLVYAARERFRSDSFHDGPATMPMKTLPFSALLFSALLFLPALALAQTPPQTAVSLPMPGIEIFHPVTATVASGSTPRPEAMPMLRKAGFTTLISFRLDTEEGYDRPVLEAAATAAGLRYISIPFNRENPDPAAAQRFLEVMAAPETGAAYVFCHSGQRVAAMWAIKRVEQDGWPLDRAMAEAESLGLTRPELKTFAMKFVASTPD
jgi:uncharacterized protein (TIGR01244 family)